MNRYTSFIKIIELGSFTKAAESLGYTQSAISQMVKSLEKELSIKLLIRSKSGIKLTPDGEKLFPYIKKLGQSYEELLDANSEIQHLAVGTLSIATFSSVSCHVLPHIIKNFSKKYPNIEIRLFSGDYMEVKNWIASGRADFGFINPLYNDSFQLEELFSVNMLAILPKEHRLSNYDKVPLLELEQENYILLEEGAFGEPMGEFSKEHLSPNINYRIQDDYTIMSMVEQGLGVSIISELMLLRSNYNIISKQTVPPITQTIALAYRDISSLSSAAKQFITFLKENIDCAK